MIEKYSKEYAKRFYRREKNKFAEEIQKDFEGLGYKTLVDERKIRFSKVRNSMVGNFKTAKNIIVVPYDTPSHIFWPGYKYYPQEGNYFMKKNFLPTYGPMLLSYVVLLLMVYIMPQFLPIQYQFVLFGFSIIYLLGVLTFIIKGFPNSKNTVRNTVSIAMAYDIAQGLNSTQRKECAFVFMDHSSVKSFGPQAFEEFMKGHQRKTNKIVLYCIGRGSEISVGYIKGSRKEANELLKKYKGSCNVKSRSMDVSDCMNTPMESLQNAIVISSGEMIDTHLCVKDSASGKDNNYDTSLYDDVKKMILEYLK